jgi:uncharacterized OsmC-like protein
MEPNEVTMNIRYESDMKFRGENTSGHTIPVEPCACQGGSGNSPDPFDYLLVSLGSCTGMKVVRSLSERGARVESLRISIAGKRRAQPPAVLENLHVTFSLAGKLDKTMADDVICDAMTHCPVAVMMSKATTVTWEYRNA